MPKIGFFGGSFDPIHNGHVSLALCAIKELSLEKVLLCPAHFAPLRNQKPLFSSADRMSMVDSLSKIHGKLEPFDYEVISGKTCYTYETLQFVKRKYPKDEIIVMLGEDQISQIQKWKFSRQLIEEYSILVFQRTSKAFYDSSFLKSLKTNIKKLRNPLYPHSSTEIRKRIERGLDISSLVPEPVFNIIKNHILINHFSP